MSPFGRTLVRSLLDATLPVRTLLGPQPTDSTECLEEAALARWIQHQPNEDAITPGRLVQTLESLCPRLLIRTLHDARLRPIVLALLD